MPRRQGLLLDELTEWDWLCRCAVRAAKGKHHRLTVQDYFNNFDQSTADICQALRQYRLPVGRYRSFEIHDPKARIIHAAPFPDRVAHHALIGKMAARLETSWVHSSYACRPGKGSHAAILRACNVAKQSQWLVKLDVHSYFAFIDHGILWQLLQRQFKGDAIFRLLDAVLGSYSVQEGRGLPIGALTSQYFANHYLDGLQRFLRLLPEVENELRYMDDVLIGCASRQDAIKIVDAATEWLHEHRKLKFKPAVIQRSAVGMTFCGFRICRKGLRPGIRRLRSISRQYRRVVADYHTGASSEIALQSRLCAIAALERPGQHRSLMRKIMKDTGADQIC